MLPREIVGQTLQDFLPKLGFLPRFDGPEVALGFEGMTCRWSAPETVQNGDRYVTQFTMDLTLRSGRVLSDLTQASANDSEESIRKAAAIWAENVLVPLHALFHPEAMSGEMKRLPLSVMSDGKLSSWEILEGEPHTGGPRREEFDRQIAALEGAGRPVSVILGTLMNAMSEGQVPGGGDMSWIKLHVTRNENGEWWDDCRLNNEPWQAGVKALISNFAWPATPDWFTLRQYIFLREIPRQPDRPSLQDRWKQLWR